MIQDINILYHGTGATFENPDLDNSREDVDFGVGFYTTQNKEMAKKWASSKRKSTINTYSFNRIGDLKIYTFKLDEEWLDFVTNNRLGIDSQKKYDKYDILIGPTAENKVFDTVNEYIKGTYTKKEAIQYITVAGFDQQIVFKTEKAIQSLKFIKRELLEPDEKAFIKLQVNKDRKNALDKLDCLKKRNSKKSYKNEGESK